LRENGIAAPGAVPAPAVTEAMPTFAAPAHWRAIDLMSDLHLAENTPRGFEAWAAHLRHTSADAVFILGDLFDAWIGDDMAESGFEARCAEVLSDAAERLTLAFMPGNRDFLVGDTMLASTGVARLIDPTLVTAFGQRVVLAHGDALCVDDLAYQRYRRFVHRPSAQRVFAALPLAVRRRIGTALRGHSGRREPRAAGHFIDVDAGAALALLRDARAPTLVHGHTHAPARHVLSPEAIRLVLSDWELDGSSVPRAEVMRWSAAGFERIAPQTGSDSAPAGAS
jgi:UDP-2,3-diacylglucosamine hydrolase